MTVSLRKSLQTSVPQTQFGPFRLLQALPWLVLAAAMRVIAFGGGAVALPAIIVANLAVLQAFLATATRSIEAEGGQTGLGNLDFIEQFQLMRVVLWRIVALMMAVAVALLALGFDKSAANMLLGIDGMAFDQSTVPGKFWSAFIAALILLILVGAEQNNGKVALFAALREFARRWYWLGGAAIVLGIAYLGLGLVQGLVRSAIWNFWQTAEVSQFIKNLIYFVFIFGFAMLRLWMTLFILTYGLKQSFIHDG
ncbi:MAG TPA: hypothetical protein VGD96_12305 [Bradyrhizobium sp.]